MLAGLDRFREIVVDFSGVRSLGQGFADEVFRVFPSRHTSVRICVQNASAAVKAMILHVVDNTHSDRVTID